MLTSHEISAVVKAKGGYTRSSETRHFSHAKEIINKQMEKSRFVEMAALEGYVQLLRDVGHEVVIRAKVGRRCTLLEGRLPSLISSSARNTASYPKIRRLTNKS